MMNLLADDLLEGQTNGYTIKDMSSHREEHERVFQLKVLLLFWVGDYPGQGKASMMTHCGKFACHWCKQYFHTISTGKSIPIDTRKHLPAGHPMRDLDDGSRETGCCEYRTHTQTLAEGQQTIDYTGAWDSLNNPAKATGVDGVCALSHLELFDVIFDFLPDMMHIPKQILKGHLLPLLKGERRPAHPSKPKGQNYTDEEKEEADEKYKRDMRIYSTVVLQQDKWVLSQKKRDEIDQRCLELEGTYCLLFCCSITVMDGFWFNL
jgi:hypothetical protein